MRKGPSQRLLPQAEAPAQPLAVKDVPTPVYKSWGLWLALGALTAGIIAVVVGAWFASTQQHNIPVGPLPGPRNNPE